MSDTTTTQFHPNQWWTSSGLSAKGKIGTAAVALSLLLVTAVVWTSPSIDISSAEELLSVEMTEEERLRAEVAQLRAELDAQDESDYVALLEPPEEGKDSGALLAPPAASRSGSGDAGSAGGGATTAGFTGSGTNPSGASGSAGSAGGGSSSSDGPANPSNPSLPDEPSTPPATPSKPGTPKPEPVTAPSKAELLSPSERYYGMYTEQSPFNWAVLDDAASKTGVLPDLVGYFDGWDRDFRPHAVTRAWEREMLPVLTWESRPFSAANDQVSEPDYSLPKIIDGEFDAYLRQYARDIAELGLPLGIRLNHEMNGVWYPWSEVDGRGESINGNSEGDFVAMWRHVHDIFSEEGAGDLVIWIWAPNIVNNLPTTLQDPATLEGLYPGDDYVDWVGLSGYYRPPYRADQTPTFSYTFDRSLDQLRDLTDKPILLSEIGASEVGGQKPAWVTSFFEGLAQPENADVLGFAWFNLAVTTYSGGERVTNDWRVDSRRDSLAAFVRGLADPRTRMGGAPYPAVSAASAPVEAVPDDVEAAASPGLPAGSSVEEDEAGPDAGRPAGEVEGEDAPAPADEATASDREGEDQDDGGVARTGGEGAAEAPAPTA
ncbi:glycosyl hydrolase, partial [Actinotalea sp. C106]|uniref:glycosyl hydrolase n=1 Tax=Actinotalea sp. C106 TaxID=2908644 RepID=UPI002029108C